VNRRTKILGTKATNTCKFILPMINLNFKKLPYNFLNAYLIKGKLEVVLVFNLPNENDYGFSNFLNEIENNPSYNKYEEDYDEILLYFNIFDYNFEDLKLFLEGKYSLFSEDYKNKLLEIYGRESHTLSYKVNMIDCLYPQNSKKKQILKNIYDDYEINEKIKWIKEVLDPPDLNYEYFKPITKITKIKQAVDDSK